MCPDQKFPSFVVRRKENFARLKAGLLDLQDSFILPEPCENSDPCWFGFLITCKEGCDRNKVVRYAESRACRPGCCFPEI